MLDARCWMLDGGKALADRDIYPAGCRGRQEVYHARKDTRPRCLIPFLAFLALNAMLNGQEGILLRLLD